MAYPHLFSEGRIGRVTLRNRTVLAPMVTGMANYDGTPSEQLMAYYEERAKNGLGLLITGATRVNYVHGAIIPRQTSMVSDRHIAPFAAMVDRVHAQGAKVFCQLHHPGRQGISLMSLSAPSTELVGRLWPGLYDLLPKLFALSAKSPVDGEWMAEHMRWPAVVAPSNVPCELYHQRARALMKWEIKGLEKQFVRAARRVQLTGADGVELHAAHGYLIEQFLSTYTNRRTDEYGGSLDNRMRFLLDIISGIRRECGPDFPIVVRLSVDEFYRRIGMPDTGIELEEGVEMARRLEKAGIDAIDVTCATYDTTNYWCEPMSFEVGWRKYLARAVKEAVSIPVIAANLIRSAEQAEAQIADGTQDFISLGRPFLADPAWAAKAMEGREDEVRRCISCLRCIESLPLNGQIGLPLECAVNPRLGRERETASPRADGKGRTVAVVGAGPAGLEAAGVLAGRGFRTVVFDRRAAAGGQLNLADRPPHKDKIDWCTEDLEAAARRAGVEFRFGTEPTVADLETLDPYAVVVATGALPVVPEIPGAGGDNVCTVNEVLEGTVGLEGKRVAVIGSGLTGLETAEKLAEDGNRLLLVEMVDEIGPGAFWQNLEDVLDRLKTFDVELLTSHKLVAVGDGEITLEHSKSGRRLTRQVDQVVLSVGVRSDDELVAKLKGRFPRVCAIGDARQPGRICSAVRDGFDTAWDL
jgi:2,4-dienoyl-CoA reductase-like NADH-dependent reductase (Old Yellow Enzyme family)/thioredoxin reductase